ncbi:hypothetical protein RFI_21132 [Reticulomyxa filosa]|uniref:Uncharacterized protein n=1 Tax=Reticulomyxa filosa TaxID=46433 RepID=X6MSY9_RETFI|nr:hypothetical protein RFI_21132 [Reticulomyxa filosa]|eukprot:ETO16225.1 hypothetical protein RFI_21132 [Reticulomyxa filosa]
MYQLKTERENTNTQSKKQVKKKRRRKYTQHFETSKRNQKQPKHLIHLSIQSTEKKKEKQRSINNKQTIKKKKKKKSEKMKKKNRNSRRFFGHLFFGFFLQLSNKPSFFQITSNDNVLNVPHNIIDLLCVSCTRDVCVNPFIFHPI